MGNRRELERVQRFLRRYDLVQIIEEGLELDILWMNGSDAYLECPDPGHSDNNPSFHVCVEDVTDSRGRCRLGWFNCWSHPVDGGLRGRNFLDFVARVRGGIWEDAEGEVIWPTEEQREEARAWIRAGFRKNVVDQKERTLARRRAAKSRRREELVWPPSVPIAQANGEFVRYIERRGITPDRALELGLRAVRSPGDRLRGVLGRTVPGVLFPIRWRGEDVNWFVRGIFRRLPSHVKGRYCPGVPLGMGSGILWAPDGIRPRAPKVIVEGIFDAERVRGVCRENGFDYDVVAVLGGRLYGKQAAHLRDAEYVIHVADGDRGGVLLGQTVEKELGSHTNVITRMLPPGMDPDDVDVSVLRGILQRPRVPPRVRSLIRKDRGI